MSYYHGTVRDLTMILPAETHGEAVTFASDTDRTRAYATMDLWAAWHYAELAHDWCVNSMARGPFPIPRVYEVEPIGEVTEDPNLNFSMDVCSPTGFRVIREMPWNDDLGESVEWQW